MARHKAELELTLDDRVTKPMRDIDRNLANLRDANMRNTQALDAARGRMLDAVAIGYVAYNAFSKPIAAAVAFSTKLEDIRQKADLTAQEIERLSDSSRKLGLSTAQGAGEIATAIDTLVGFGVDPEAATLIAEPLGRAASAYNAATEDLASTSAAVMTNLKVPVSLIGYVFDILAKGGKAGAFELKDMATSFPAITAAAQALGMSGTEAVADLVAALELSREGAATSEEAATNLANFMTKILAPDSIRKFAKAGIDIVGELNAAVAAGESPLQRGIEMVNKLTEGGKADLLGALFEDVQVKKFLNAILPGFDRYIAIRDEAVASMGTVDRDFDARLATPGGAIARFEASIENFSLAVGLSLLPKLTEFITAITPMIDGVSDFVDANDKLVAGVLELAAAVIGLRVATAAISFGGAFVSGGRLFGGGKGIGGGGGAGKAGPNLGGMGMLGLLGGLGVASDLNAFSTSMKEDGGKAWLERRAANDAAMNEWLLGLDVGGFKPFGFLQDLVETAHRPPDEISSVRSEIDRLREQKALYSDGLDPASAARLAQLEGRLATLEATAGTGGQSVGQELGTGLTEGLAAKQPALSATMNTILRALRFTAAAGIDIPIRTVGPGGMLAGARAAGGPVWPGLPFLVGERGPELVTFGARGVVHPAVESARYFGNPAAMGGSARSNEAARGGLPGTVNVKFGDIVINGAHDVDDIVAQIERKLNAAISGIQADIEYAVS